MKAKEYAASIVDLIKKNIDEYQSLLAKEDSVANAFINADLKSMTLDQLGEFEKKFNEWKITRTDAGKAMLQAHQDAENHLIYQTLRSFLKGEQELMEKRRGSDLHGSFRTSVVESVVKEMSDKWDAMARIINKEVGIQYMNTGGYMKWHRENFSTLHNAIDMNNAFRDRRAGCRI